MLGLNEFSGDESRAVEELLATMYRELCSRIFQSFFIEKFPINKSESFSAVTLCRNVVIFQ